MNYAVLKQHILDDDEHLGFAELIAGGNDQGVADLWNEETDDLVEVASLPRDSFLTAILPATLALATKDAAVQAKWDRLLAVACAASSVSKASWTALSNLAVADGLLTSDYADSVFKRKGSRVEVLFGTGAAVSSSDISFALRGTR